MAAGVRALAAGAGSARRQQCGRGGRGRGCAGGLYRAGGRDGRDGRGLAGLGLGACLGRGASSRAGVRVLGRVLCWGVGVRCAVSCGRVRVGVWCFRVQLVVRGVPCGVMGWLVWSWLFGVVWFTLPTKLAMQKHPISMLYLCWLANPLAGRNRLSGAGHWTLGFPSFPRRPLI